MQVVETWARPQRGPWRWVVSVAAILLVVGLALAALSEAGRPSRLGISAQSQDGQTVVSWVLPASPGWYAGVRPGDVVLSVDGHPIVPEADSAIVLSTSLLQVMAPSGDPRTAPAGPMQLPTPPLHRIAFVAIALSLSVLGAVVFALAREGWASGTFLALSVAGAAALVASLGQPAGAPWTYAVTYAALVGFGASSLLLFLMFPIGWLASAWGKRLLVGSMAVHLALIGAYPYVLVVNLMAYELVQKFLLGVLAFDLLGAMTLAVAAVVRLRPERAQARHAMRLVAVGATLGFAPLALASLAPNALGFGYLVSPYVSVLSLVFFPVAIGGALLSRELMGIQRLMRRGLVALAVWMVLLAVGSGGIYVLHSVDAFLRSPISIPVTIAAITLAFPAVQAMLRRKLERALFDDIYDSRETMREMGRRLAMLSQVGPMAEYVLTQLGETLGLSWAALQLERSGTPAVFSWGDPPPALPTAQRADGPGSSGDFATAIPLVADETRIGTLLVGPKRRDLDLLPEDINLLEILAPILATSLEKALLLERLEEQMDALARRERELAALSSKLMHAQEEERARLAMDLHDDPLQRALLLVRELDGASGGDAAAQWRVHAEEIVVSLKALSAGLRPPTLDDFGLAAGLQWLATEVSARSDVSVLLEIQTADGGPFGRLERDLELALYRVAQEGLNNCLKHAEATQATVTLRREPHSVWLELADNGKGFEIDAEDHTLPLHFGILGMQERLRPWHGTLRLERLSPGTLVSAHVPAEEGSEPTSQ